MIGAVLCFFASIADKEKTVSFDKIGCTSAIEASFIALGLHYFCHFLSAPRLMKKVAERIFIAPPIWILCCCNHSLLYKSCIAVHQVDDVGMVLGVLVL